MRWSPVVIVALCATQAQAQSGAYPDLLTDMQRSRKTVLAYVEAMPDSAMNFRPTRGVRSFAEQFDHLATTNYEVAAVALRGLKSPPPLADSTKYLHDKAALWKYVAATYDYYIDALEHATPAQLKRAGGHVRAAPSTRAAAGGALVRAFGVDSGQVIPYLRLNGVKPPEYSMPF